MTTATYISRYCLLEQTYAGVTNPEEMGTTGLIGWVITGPGGDKRGYNRLRRAVRIIRGRGGSAERFCQAVLIDIPNRWQRERFAGYLKTVLRRGDHG